LFGYLMGCSFLFLCSTTKEKETNQRKGKGEELTPLSDCQKEGSLNT